MKIAEAWHAFHVIAEIESVHRLVTIATRTFKFMLKIPLLWSYQAINVWILQLLWQHSYDVIPLVQCHEMHARLLRFSSCIPVLILKSQRLKFSQTNNFSQINKFFVTGEKIFCYNPTLKQMQLQYNSSYLSVTLIPIQVYMSPVKRICVFEHSVMTNFNCACPAIQRGQGSGFLSEGSSWHTACMSEQRRFWRDCADAQARLNLRCSHRR